MVGQLGTKACLIAIMTLILAEINLLVSADPLCPASMYYPPYLIGEGTKQPDSALIVSGNQTEVKYCFPDPMTRQQLSVFQETSNVEKRYFWFALGVALFKGLDWYLKFDSIKNNCSHFGKGNGAKNNLSCVVDIISTIASWGGVAYKGGKYVKQYHQWISNNGWHILTHKREEIEEVKNMIELLEALVGANGHQLYSFEPGLWDTDIHIHHSLQGSNKRESINSDTLIESVMVHAHDENGNLHQYHVGDNHGAVHVAWMPIPAEQVVKRSDGRYETEKISGGGVEANLCRNDADSGVTNTGSDFRIWRTDVNCHKDFSGHSGVYLQGYDNNAQGTLFSASVAPYTNLKKGVLNKMTKCPHGIGHECGDKN